MKPEHLKLLSDKDWRLNNLYWITDKEGKPTRFSVTRRIRADGTFTYSGQFRKTAISRPFTG